MQRAPRGQFQWYTHPLFLTTTAVPTAVRSKGDYRQVQQSGWLLLHYFLACILKAAIEELYKIRRVNLIEEHQIAKLVEGF